MIEWKEENTCLLIIVKLVFWTDFYDMRLQKYINDLVNDLLFLMMIDTIETCTLRMLF